jgi:hypothetical protein
VSGARSLGIGALALVVGGDPRALALSVSLQDAQRALQGARSYVASHFEVREAERVAEVRVEGAEVLGDEDASALDPDHTRARYHLRVGLDDPTAPLELRSRLFSDVERAPAERWDARIAIVVHGARDTTLSAVLAPDRPVRVDLPRPRAERSTGPSVSVAVRVALLVVVLVVLFASARRVGARARRRRRR